jgi:Kyakuja-Dileera-Zisupton transposase
MPIQGIVSNCKSHSFTDNSCFQLEDEIELNPSVIGSLDGNNSLKRFVRDDRQTDTLTFDSDYFIQQEYVDQFSHKVKRTVKKPGDKSVCIIH